jgi:Fucosyltransferase, N-terminal
LLVAKQLLIDQHSSRKENQTDNIIPRSYHTSSLFQIWIVQYHESPRLPVVDSTALGDLVNWTVTYRRDSTIQFPYGFMLPKDQPKHTATNKAKIAQSSSPAVNYAAGKKKKVAWIVSNCNDARNGRNNYVTELQK